MRITILSAVVCVHPKGTDDHVSLLTNLPPPQKKGVRKLLLTFRCDHGTGANYVKENLKLIPTVVKSDASIIEAVTIKDYRKQVSVDDL